MIKKRFNVVVDGQAGSCGKGLIASYLAWKHLPPILTTTNMANAGHCQTADTYIITDRGIERLGEVVTENNCGSVANMDGEYEAVSHHHYDGVRSVNEIRLTNGTKFRCTDAHQYYVWDVVNTTREWVRSMDLDVDRHVFLAPRSVAFPQNRLLPESFEVLPRPNRTIINLPSGDPERIDERYAEYLGLLVGDGYYAGVQKIQIAFHEDQLDAADRITQLYRDMGIAGVVLKRVKDKKCFTLTIGQVSGMNKLFGAVGLARAIKQHKTTPRGVLRSSKRTIAAYLRGLFDADGSAKKDRVQLSNCARSVVEDAQQMLYVLGIHSCLTVGQCNRPTKAGRRLPQYILSISGSRDMRAFQEVVGFISAVKKDRLGLLVANTRDQGKILSLSVETRAKLKPYGLALRGNTRTSAVLDKPQLATTGDERLAEMHASCEQYHMIPMKSLSRSIDTLEVFDVTVPGTHSYLANGCVSHNTAVNHDGRSFVAKALPSPTALSKWYPDYNPTVVVGASAAFSFEQLLREVAECEIRDDQLMIHPRAGVITDAHREAESDLRTGTKHIASTMQGCGAFLADKIMRRPELRLARDYPGLSSYVLPEHDRPGAVNLAEWLHDRLVAGDTILHEGSQGFSLDISHGSSYPACTSRGTTAVQNLADMGLPVRAMGDVYLVIRPYPIKVGHVVEDGVTVGHSGGHYPDQEELTWEYVAEQAGMPAGTALQELTTVTKRVRRCFTFSKTQLRQAALVNGATRIALNFANYIDYSVAGTNSVEFLTPKVNDFIKMVEDLTGVPVTLVGTGPRIDQVVDLE